MSKNLFVALSLLCITAAALACSACVPFEGDLETIRDKAGFNNFTVTFNANDGSPTPAPQTVKKGNTAAAPEGVTRHGYTLDGWYKEAALATQWDFAGDTVSKNITLYAKWNENPPDTYTVTFVTNGGTPVHDQAVSAGERANEPEAVTRDFHSFGGWYTDNDTFLYRWNFDTPVTGDMILYGKWAIYQYTVTFESNGGTPVPARQTVDHGAAAAEPEGVALAGHTLAGWYTDNNTFQNKWDFSAIVTGTITLYAKWNENPPGTHTATFVSNGGTPVSDQAVSAGGKAAEPPVAKDHHTFGGWYMDNDTFQYRWNFNTAVTGDITLYAKWTIHQYTVTFNVDGGTPAPEPQTVDHGAKVSEPAAVSKTAYTFGGWFREAAFINQWNFASDTVTADTALYAKWNINQYTVTFASNGGTPVPGQTVSTGGKAAEPDSVSRDHHTFGGWYIDNDTFQYRWNFNTPVTGDITLYAKWTIYQYTVTFVSNGGTPSPARQIIDHGATAAEPEGVAFAGHTLAGWYTDNNTFQNRWDFSAVVTSVITLYAKWNENPPDTYTATFVSNGGSPVSDQAVTAGEKAGEPDGVTYAGHILDGWYTDNNTFRYRWNFNNPVSGNTTLYAKWTIYRYTVSFESNGGTPAPAAQTIDHGAQASEPAGMNRNGYTFGGWYTEAALVNQWNFSGNTVTGAMTLYARWIPVYTVTFNADSGTPAPAQQNIVAGGTAAEPAAVSKTGCAFGGWYTDNDTFLYRWNFNTPVTAHTALYAKWTLNTYTISFNADGGTPAPAAQTIDHGNKVSEPASMSKTGYTFGGWYKESAFTSQWNFANDAVTGAAALYAKWTLNQYTVTFNADSGTPAPAAQTVGHGAQASEPAAVSKTGCTFGGWYTDNDTFLYRWNFSAPVTGGATLYAKWNINRYTVTFNADGGTPAPAAQTIDHGAQVSEPAAMTRTGYTFGGWFRESALTNQWNFTSGTVTGGITLYAKWNENPPNTHTATFVTNGGTSVPDQTVITGEKAAEPEGITKDHHTFGGWYSDNNTFLYRWNFNTPVTGNITLYAKWNINQYTVTFSAASGTPAPAAQTIDHGAKVSEPAAMTRTGYTFGGWYKESSLTNQWSFANDTVTGGITLYAKWTLNQYTVTFSADSGTPAPIAQTIDHGAKVSEPAAMTRTGYTFGGWYKENALTNQWSFANDTVTGAAALYARWYSTVTFNANGATGGTVPATQTANAGSGITLPGAGNLVRTGYTFGGWNENASGTAANHSAGNTYTPSGDSTLYAKWNINQYTVTFSADGGTPAPAAQTVGHGAQASEPAAMTRTGYTFGGWYTESALTNQWNFTSGTVTGGITLYAKWNINQYTVTFNANGGTPAPAAQTVGHGAQASEPAAVSKTGYTFGGWYTDNDTFLYRWNFSAPVTGAAALYAHWIPNSAGITLDVKQIVDGAPIIADITISRTGNGHLVRFPVSINAADYDAGSITWEVAGVGVYAGQTVSGSGPLFILNAGEVKYNSLGIHALTLTVTKNGMKYQRAIPFTIVQ